jgi:hypothetical protein
MLRHAFNQSIDEIHPNLFPLLLKCQPHSICVFRYDWPLVDACFELGPYMLNLVEIWRLSWMRKDIWCIVWKVFATFDWWTGAPSSTTATIPLSVMPYSFYGKGEGVKKEGDNESKNS